MAIRKPVLSVKEARSLAAHRTDLPSLAPHEPVRDPLAFQAHPQAEYVPAAPAAPERGASMPTELVSVEVQPNTVSLPEAPPAEDPGPGPVLAAMTGPVAIVAEAPPPAPSVSEADTGLRRKTAEKKSRRTAPNIGPPIAKRQKQQVIGKRSEEGKIQVFLSAALPAKSVSKSFELLSRQYAPAKSLQMILRRAMDDYEVLLENGDLDNLPETYIEAAAPEACGIIQTSRIMPTRLIERARAHFDPLGFESDRAFGRKLASAALAIFFEIQAQHQ